MTFTIREIRPSDNLEISDVIRQSLVEFGANRPGFAWADPELDALFDAYQAENAVYYVVTQNNAVVGGGGVAPFPCEYSDICELQKMYLSNAHRGQGIGSALMKTLLQAAQSKGYRGCYLETLGTMQSAVHLYKKFGFERLSEPLGNSGHSGCNLFYLRWFT